MIVSVVIPTIPPRARMGMRAIGSVLNQSRPVDELIVVNDLDAIGAAANRNRGLAQASGKYVAFLDDDDEMGRDHVAKLLDLLEETDADLAYPWFNGINAEGIFYVEHDGEMKSPEGLPFDEQLRQCILTTGNFIPVTVLVRRELILDVGGFAPLTDDATADQCDDWSCWQRMLKAGATFVHLPERTWTWHGHPGHTSGRKWTEVYA